jgi:SSS family solute:Na+ symporter
VAANAAVLLLFAFVPPAFGILARALHPGLGNPELALPTVLMKDVPPVIGALGLAAVVSAEVSTIDALLFMLATSLSQDLYRRFVAPGAEDARILRVARITAVGAGALGVALAIAAPSVIGALTIFYTLLSVSLFVPVVAGLGSRTVGTMEALCAIVGGVAAVLAVQIGGLRVLGAPPVLAGLVASVAVCVALTLARGRWLRPRG